MHGDKVEIYFELVFYLENSSQVRHFSPVDVYIFLKEKEVLPGNFLCKTDALGGGYAVFPDFCLLSGTRGQDEGEAGKDPRAQNVRRPLSQCQSWACMPLKVTTPYTVHLCLPQPPPSPALCPTVNPTLRDGRRPYKVKGKGDA